MIGAGVAAGQRKQRTVGRLAPRFDGPGGLRAGLQLGHAQAVLLGAGQRLLQRQPQRRLLRRGAASRREHEQRDKRARRLVMLHLPVPSSRHA